MSLRRLIATAVTALTAVSSMAATIIMPQGRNAYFSREAIEIAVVGLAAGETATLTLTPADRQPGSAIKSTPLSLPVTGDGGAVTVILPAYSLAPSDYQVDAGGDAVLLQVRDGIHRSTMYVSQTGRPDHFHNFTVSNLFSTGLTERDGQPALEPRRASRPMQGYNDAFAENTPDLIYMYWTGFVLHKPWGSEKEWSSRDEIENQRLFNFRAAQQLRRYSENILMVGSLDEPGLPWGRTPAGGSATGFPGWNTAYYYEERGWPYSDDPAGGDDASWMTYTRIRAGMLRNSFQLAHDDLHAVWPEVVYSTDSYAPQAFMDGTDPMNQVANDVPSTHVFADYGLGKLGVLGGLYLEKAHDPTVKVAHAMNGQLFGTRLSREQSVPAYHLMMNVLLAAGLKSNWWLNFGPLVAEDTVAVNEPPSRLGPVFVEMAPSDHDVALLWSFTEIAMRCKDVTAKEAHKANGEQIKLMVADLPETAESDEQVINAYSVGGNYRNEIIAAHTAMTRAGYPAHIIHEDLIADGILDDYRVLVITGQTFAMPAATMAVIAAFQAKGGVVIVDQATTVEIPGALVTTAKVANQGYKWTSVFGLLKQVQDGKSPVTQKAASYYQTNHYMESFSRDASGPFRATLQQTKARPVMVTDSVDLACERHIGGEGELVMVINGYEALPEIADDESYAIWNYAPLKATYSLPIIPAGRTVYAIEGISWDQVSTVAEPTKPITGEFAAGEMKLYLVAPRPATGLTAAVQAADGALQATATLQGPKMPWPLTVTVTRPDGTVAITLRRATGADGVWRETLPLGRNADAGTYTITVTSPVGGFTATAAVEHRPLAATPMTVQQPARSFDGPTITAFLQSKPAVTIARTEANAAVAETLAGKLRAAGLTVTVADEDAILSKALYPRVFDPYAKLYSPEETDRPLPTTKMKDPETRTMVDAPLPDGRNLVIQSEYYETPTVTTPEGEVVTDWNTPGTRLTVGARGYILMDGTESYFKPGCKLVVDGRKRLQIINGAMEKVKTTDEFRAEWQRPWLRITGHVGGFNLTPQLPECYTAEGHLIVLGSSADSQIARVIQAAELPQQVADAQYPGTGKALVSYVWSPFQVGDDLILIAATDPAGLEAGAAALIDLATKK